MIRRVLSLILLGLLLLMSAAAQDPAPTLVPPTPVPWPDTGADERVRTESGVARILETGRVRVGVLYNAPPFGELTLRGEVAGYDADLARALAEAWGVELRLRQVTRQTALEMLDDGRVDLLIATQVHTRELDRVVEFSQTYHLGAKAIMVRADDPAETLAAMGSGRVGVVLGTDAERALRDWTARADVPVTIETYLTLDRLYGALRSGQVDGAAGSRHELVRAAVREPESIRILEEALELEPYAVAVPRQDVSLRNLVNATLQYLQLTGGLSEISGEHFSETAYDSLAIWDGLGESPPRPDQFDTAIRFPQRYVVPRIQTEQTLRVAGVQGITAGDSEATEAERRLEIFHRTLMDSMARRWGATVQYIPATPEEAVALVESGQADIAIGVEPNWAYADRVDFTGPYLLRGLRLMVPTNSGVFGFAELRGNQWVAIANDDPTARSAAETAAAEANAFINIIESNPGAFARTILEDDNADVALADSIVLMPYLEQMPDDFQLTQDWYSQTFLAMAVPYNDIDFRLLVEYTLQELVRDGTLARMLGPLMPAEDVPEFDVWPGPQDYFGFQLGG